MHNLKHLSNDKKSLILKLLRKHEEIFDDILGNYTDSASEYKKELLEGSKLHHAKHFLFPKYVKKL